jgi:hypothetical protein
MSKKRKPSMRPFGVIPQVGCQRQCKHGYGTTVSRRHQSAPTTPRTVPTPRPPDLVDSPGRAEHLVKNAFSALPQQPLKWCRQTRPAAIQLAKTGHVCSTARNTELDQGWISPCAPPSRAELCVKLGRERKMREGEDKKGILQK